jgi:superoxide dismutase, Fe-Mn family
VQYHLAPLFCRPWTLNGITPRLIESHYEDNYGSALRRLNAITEELEALDPATASIEVINRLKRDEAVALSSTLLHELNFASLGGDRREIPDAMANALARERKPMSFQARPIFYEYVALTKHGNSGGPATRILQGVVK